MTDIEIRVYEPNDESAVDSLWQLAFPDEPKWNESSELIARKLTVQPELFFVAIKEKQVVGTTIAGFDGVRGWVHKVATHPDHLRQGVARLLMAAAEKGLQNLGCKKFNLQVREGNTGAVEFYLSLGFDVEHRTSLGKKLT